MDRYFERDYDPMLDVRPEVREDTNGLVEDEGWDRMMRVLKEKEDRKQARKAEKVKKESGRLVKRHRGEEVED